MNSWTCIQRSPLRQRKNDSIRQLTLYLRLVDLYFQLQSTIIHVFL
jgi:hypothetical protein